MATPRQRKSISLENLNPLRTRVRAAYQVATGDELPTTRDKNNAGYDELRTEIRKAVNGSAPSPGTIVKFLYDSQNRTYHIAVLAAFEKFAEHHLGKESEREDKLRKRVLSFHRSELLSAIESENDFLSLSVEFLSNRDIATLRNLPGTPPEMNGIRWDLIEQRLGRNPNILKGLVLANKFNQKDVLGFFILYPISEGCKLKIQTGKLSMSDQFQAKDLCESFKDAAALYVSWVFAVTRSEKGYLVFKLGEELRSIVLEHKTIDDIYTRPTTEDGRRLVSGNGFSQMGQSSLYFQKAKDFAAK